MTVNVALLSATIVDVRTTVRTQADSAVLASLAQAIASEIADKTGYRGRVEVEMIPSQVYSMLQPGELIPEQVHCSLYDS